MATDKAYYRSLHKNEWKTIPTLEKDVTGVLYPDFVRREILAKDKATGKMFVKSTRDPDVTVRMVGAEQHADGGGGTSMHDYSGALTPSFIWREFVIPKGTEMPAGIRIVQRGNNLRHYQIEVAAGTMEIDAFRGALDTLARNAIVKANAGVGAI